MLFIRKSVYYALEQCIHWWSGQFDGRNSETFTFSIGQDVGIKYIQFANVTSSEITGETSFEIKQRDDGKASVLQIGL